MRRERKGAERREKRQGGRDAKEVEGRGIKGEKDGRREKRMSVMQGGRDVKEAEGRGIKGEKDGRGVRMTNRAWGK